MPITKNTLEKYLVEIRRISEHRTKGSEKKIRRIYKLLQKNLQSFLANQYEKYAIDDQLTYAILQQKGQYANFLENVQKHVDGISPQLSKEITKTVKDTYKICFNGMIDSVEKAIAGKVVLNKVLNSIRTVTPNIIKKAVENPISGLTLNDILEKNRKDIIYNIKQNIGIGLVNGDRYSTMARRITDSLDSDYKKSIRIVRTETHRNIETGLHDSATEINDTFSKNDIGVNLVKTWRTMKDERVRPNISAYKRKVGVKAKKKYTTNHRSYLGVPNHVKMEGISVKENELFDLGAGIKTRAPGESGIAGHDINCRCFLEWELTDESKKIVKDINKSEIKNKENENISFLNNITEYDVSTTAKRKILARKVLDELELEGIPISIKKIQNHGYCEVTKDKFNFNFVKQYVLNSEDNRANVYKIKTMFHEAYHAKSHMNMTDISIIGRKAWMNIEEIFAESSSHYITKQAGFNEILAPSYADKFVKFLPRLKYLAKYAQMKTIYEFGKWGWNNRITDGKAVWSNIYTDAMKVDFDWKKYVSDNYITYVDKNIEELMDNMLDNMPQIRHFKEYMKKDYLKAKRKLKSGEELNDNEDMVLVNLVANAMMRIGVK